MAHDIPLVTQTGRSLIRIADVFDSLPALCNGRKTLVLYDAALPAPQLPGALELEAIATGEALKSFSGIAELYRLFMRHDLDKNSLVIGFGGGSLSDALGFAAATFMRGIALGLCPTTLLAQTDAAIGGKNALNIDGVKNVAGLIRQPEFVLINTSMLLTLDPHEFSSGMAEVIKHAVIADVALFEFLEANVDRILRRDRVALERMLRYSIAVKTNIVSKDEHESGLRRLLNFGHSFGHAYEARDGIGHGPAVALGMLSAARLSLDRSTFSHAEFSRLSDLLSAYGLPSDTPRESARLIDYLSRDKKRCGTHINLVLLKHLGEAYVHPVALSELDF